MKKSTLIILASVVALSAALFVLMALNRHDLELSLALRSSGQFAVCDDGEVIATVSGEDLRSVGLTRFTAIMDTSLTDPEEVEFEGVELKKLLEYLEIERAFSSCEFFGSDGFASAVSRSETEKDGCVYICVAMNGQALKDREQGGMGPYLMVVADARFSARWCKYVERIELK